MTIFAVTYVYVPDAQAQSRVRPERYGFFQRLEADGALLASGQLMDAAQYPGATDTAKADGEETDTMGHGMLVLQADSVQAAEKLLEDDPYLVQGLVTRRLISQWNVSVGRWGSPE